MTRWRPCELVELERDEDLLWRKKAGEFVLYGSEKKGGRVV